MEKKRVIKKEIVTIREAATIPSPPGADASPAELEAYFSTYSWDQIEKAGHMRALTEDETAWVGRISAESKKRIDARQSASAD